MTYPRGVRFEWDDAKDLLNREKHGVSFAEARRLFESGEDPTRAALYCSYMDRKR
jgi:uncharacterized DUF497 family protein